MSHKKQIFKEIFLQDFLHFSAYLEQHVSVCDNIIVLTIFLRKYP